jgi:hypothetical protein
MVALAAIALRSRYADPPHDLNTFFREFCGPQKPRGQMKEAFLEQAIGIARKELCPNRLDDFLKQTNHREAVRGWPKKRAALFPKSAWPGGADCSWAERARGRAGY